MSVTSEAAEVMFDILSALEANQKWNDLLQPNQRECIGRELCLTSLAKNLSSTPVQKLFYLMESFALLYLQLEDHSQPFAYFIEAMIDRQPPQTDEDCYHLFRFCGTPEMYAYRPAPSVQI